MRRTTIRHKRHLLSGLRLKMAKNPLVLRLIEPRRADAILELIREGTMQQFTTVVSTKDTPVGDLETVFLGLTPGRIDYLARVQRGTRPATFQCRLSLSDFVVFDWGIDEWAELLPKSKRLRLQTLLQAGGRFTDALWRDALAELRKSRPAIGYAFKKHESKSRLASRKIDTRESETTILEREALAFALETWGGSRERSAVLLKASPISARAPFLANLNEVDIRETTAIEHDSSTIPGYELIKRYLVGAVEFANPVSKLTVLNANLKPLEHVLGVDLVYYNHVFKSFVLIQYKRMGSVLKGRPCYRPDTDSNFKHECDRMEEWLKQFQALPRQAAGHLDVRLGAGPFFFKFCDLRNASAFDTALAPGFYLPYRLLSRLLKSKASMGPRGGRVVGWDTPKRFLSNKRMMELIQGGWVGSNGSTTAKLNEVLGGVLTGKRSLIYAVSAPLRGGLRVHRDSTGRYAEEGDPLAHEEIQ